MKVLWENVGSIFGVDHAKGFTFSKKVNYGLFFHNLNPNSLIHMLFVFFKLDIFFLDEYYRVIKIKRALPFITFIIPPKNTKHMLELPSHLNHKKVKIGNIIYKENRKVYILDN